jgi:nucleoside-diphosphate-sugar epimerase
MKLLWTKDLKMNTVHVRDVVRALWHLKDAGPPGEVYNLVDKGETSEEMNVNKVILPLEPKHSVSIIDIIATNINKDLMSITRGIPVHRHLLNNNEMVYNK